MTVGPIFFAQPEWLGAVWSWLLIWVGVGLLERRGSDVLDRLVSPLLQARLVARPAGWRRWTRYGLLGVAGLALALGAMRPQMGERFVAAPRAGAEIMIAIDVSRSMLADDAPPSRLERAKAEVRDLLGYLRNDSVGLIAFAGRAGLLSPMTPDLSFLRLALEGAGPHSVPRGGTRIGEAIRRAVVGFGEPGPAQRALILITDGEDHDDFAVDAAKMAAEAGVKIIAIGFGDERGSPIFVTDPRSGAREQIRDAEGRGVISKLNGDLLRKLALETDGAFVPAGTGVLDLASIYAAHVAPLTRGELDDQGRTIRDEAYPFFLLAALLCLLAGVQVTAGGSMPGAFPGAAGRATHVVLLLGASLWIASAGGPAAAQVDPGPRAAPLSEGGTAKGGSESALGVEEAAAETAKPVSEPTPRERFNAANRALREGDPATASSLLLEARRDAVDDVELRQAATWNLGVAAVARAEQHLEQAPELALAALHEAADWLREAVALQPDAEGPRHDLEVVLRRALVLADEIAQAQQGRIEEVLDQLVERQRTHSLTCAGILEAVSGPDEQAAVDRMRPSFESEATVQRGLLTDVDDLAERVVRERDAILNMSPETRAPEEGLRAAQLEGVLVHLDAAIERMGQARRQLRQRRAERAYRRSAAALGELKRARDQLRDPVEQIGVLLGEVQGLGRASLVLQMQDRPTSSADARPEVPAFLSAASLEEEAFRIQQRTAELGERLTAAAAQALESGLLTGDGAGTPGSDPATSDTDPAARAFGQALIEAAPRVAAAAERLDQAAAAVGTARWTTALEAESEAAQGLAAARESFLDFDALLTLTIEDQGRVTLASTRTDQQTDETPMLNAIQEKNLARARRMVGQLEARRLETLTSLGAGDGDAPGAGPTGANATAEDPVAREQARFERAGQLLALAEGAMQEGLDALAELGAEPAPGEPQQGTAWARLAGASERAGAHLEALRSIFFTLVEHLEALARAQQDLNDQTASAIALAGAEESGSTEPTERGPEARVRASRIAVEQEELESRGGAIADALLAQAEQGASEAEGAADGGVPPGAATPPDAETLRQAAEHVAAAQLSMHDTREILLDEHRALDPAAQTQGLALESLKAALALLTPPPPPADDPGQQEQPEQPEDEAPGAGSPEDSPDAAPESAPDESSGSPEPDAQESEQAQAPQASDDAAQLLQGVRDRESQRRRDLERERAQGRARPVEKDW